MHNSFIMTWGEMSAVIFNLMAFRYVHPAETQMAFEKGTICGIRVLDSTSFILTSHKSQDKLENEL